MGICITTHALPFVPLTDPHNHPPDAPHAPPVNVTVPIAMSVS